MQKELPKSYNASEHEEKIYKLWEKEGYFNPDVCIKKGVTKKGAPIFSLMMPPPNVTGVLHLGHALENALMDTMARYQRMQGKRTLFLPGTDHAAVATQVRVEKDLIDSGKCKNPRKELGREKLLEIIREYAEDCKSTIISQVKKMGSSCDWSRLAYTFDEQRSMAVNAMFKKMYDDGLIYRGYRVVNWSVRGQSTCSDDELVHVERKATLYTFKYSKDFPIAIATTRPETKLGDTAVAVNPKDKRYKKYIGQEFKVDVGAAKFLNIKIIANKTVDMKFGTGALGVTPAHSQIDYEIYETQKAKDDTIGLVAVIGPDGKMTENAGLDYKGLTVFAAREKFVEYLRKNKLIEKEEEIIQNVGTSDRFKDAVEVLPMEQWFIDVNKPFDSAQSGKTPCKKKSLKDLMREAVTKGHSGDAEQKVKITPKRFEKSYLQWIDNLRDWCISRQIWWGHRIPVYYRNAQKNKETEELKNSKKIFVGEKSPGKDWEQDPDTLDTWFSSGLWTFSTLGWPDKTEDLKTYHPTTWMQMGYEILFFWMARMILMSTYALDEIPFYGVYIHGMLRNEQGKKFSKSDKIGMDPLVLVEKYGADALRMSLLVGVSPGNDSKYYEEKVRGYRNFANKIWNINRFVLMNVDSVILSEVKESFADKKVIAELNKTIKKATRDIENFKFYQAAEDIYHYVWHTFADKIIEEQKPRLEGEEREQAQQLLLHVWSNCLRLLHPFMPFVTEACWGTLPIKGKKMLIVEKWPS